MTDYVPWLRQLAAQGGAGVVNAIDARALGRIADELERGRAARLQEIDTEIVVWMGSKGYATGHGDTIVDLLNEIDCWAREQALHSAIQELEKVVPLTDPERNFRDFLICKIRSLTATPKSQVTAERTVNPNPS